MEVTLGMSRDELEAAVGHFCGFGRGDKFGERPWTIKQFNNVRSYVKSGLNRFYYPTTDGQGPPHSWSFLRPTSSIAILEGTDSTRLPDDFCNPEGDASLTTTSGTTRIRDLQFTGAGLVQQRYATLADTTGPIELLAVRPIKGTTNLRGQRSELFYWPLADQDYTLTLTYSLLMNTLTEDHPFVYGGAAHSECVLEACLSAAEVLGDDAMQLHAAMFQNRLIASIAIDRRNKPAHLGYNADWSDGPKYRQNGPWEPVVATFAGLRPDEY
jgi:hypothetical protein